jgi:XTP/dITP diphosphohydrolase
VKVALATKNPGKVREIRAILAGVDVVAPSPEWVPPEETGATYLENALLKARSLVSSSGMPAMADDSGIEVDALGGAPGPLSARYAGPAATDEENLAKLIEVVLASSVRTARYRCVAVLVMPDGASFVAEGTVEGTLVTEPRGSGGFGYDPIFVPLGHIRTMAELDPVAKDAISHRGKAFGALLPQISRLGPV